MDKGNGEIAIREQAKLRVQELFEILRKNNITLEESLALAGFLVSYVGMLVNSNTFKSIAKTLFAYTDEVLKFESDPNGISSQSSINSESGATTEIVEGNKGEESSLQSEGNNSETPSVSPETSL